MVNRDVTSRNSNTISANKTRNAIKENKIKPKFMKLLKRYPDIDDVELEVLSKSFGLK